MFKPTPVVRSHWHHTFEGLQVSPLDFYASVEAGVARRTVPDVHISRVEWAESGILSARREYLRVERGPLAFDVCSAQFGSGQFFSSWLAELVPSPLWGILGFLVLTGVYAAASAMAVLLLGKLHVGAAIVALPVLLLGYFFVLFVIGLAARDKLVPWEEGIRATPLLGWLYTVLFSPDTYYKLDTVLMFQDLVHAAVLEAVDELTETRGLRALTPEERKRTAGDMLKRKR